jgi:hypothetical protein
LARPPQKFITAAKNYVCVRITDMTGMNLNLFNFDFDLTFTTLLMNPDGKIYHRFGSRNDEDAMSWISMEALTRVMDLTIKEHTAYSIKPDFKTPPVKKIEDFKAYKLVKHKGCVRCHQVHDAMQAQLKADNKWSKEDLWIYPDPKRLGLKFDPVIQNKITESSSFAAKAGLKKGDLILKAGDQNILTISDLVFHLHNLQNKKTNLALTAMRGSKKANVTVSLPDNWKAVTPEEYSWRPTMWGISPKPGFGGDLLVDQQLSRLKLPKGSFAFRVRYIVTWGDFSHTGRNAIKAGIKKGDIIYKIDGKSDFKDLKHYHSWFRFSHKPGDIVTFDIFRGAKKMTIKMKTVE